MIVTNEGRLLGKPIRPNISHAYADDTQIYGFCPLSAIFSTSRANVCVLR